jgi:hypothetical protein
MLSQPPSMPNLPQSMLNLLQFNIMSHNMLNQNLPCKLIKVSDHLMQMRT